MLTAALLTAATLACCAPQDAAAPGAAPTTERLPVTVLYAGAAGHPRTTEWREFLAATFAKVSTIDLPKLSRETAAACDVVIVDAPPALQANGDFTPYPAPKLDLTFDKPTILLGAAAGSVLGPLRLKLWQL